MLVKTAPIVNAGINFQWTSTFGTYSDRMVSSDATTTIPKAEHATCTGIFDDLAGPTVSKICEADALKRRCYGTRFRAPKRLYDLAWGFNLSTHGRKLSGLIVPQIVLVLELELVLDFSQFGAVY
jgi:hypothetical protein